MLILYNAAWLTDLLNAQRRRRFEAHVSAAVDVAVAADVHFQLATKPLTSAAAAAIATATDSIFSLISFNRQISRTVTFKRGGSF